MPDQWGFDHLGPNHRCIEEGCGWPGHGQCVSEAERVRHHRAHIKKVEAAAEKRRLQNLALARKAKRQADRENKEVYG